MTFFKLLFHTIILNVLRYIPGGIIESYTIFEPMHQPMEQYPDCFGFTSKDLPSSYFYNFAMWFCVVLIFHIAYKALAGKMIIRSLIVFGLCFLFFASLAAIYMNHYNQDIRVFYLYSIIDGLFLFSFLGIVNGYLYPVFFNYEKH